MITGKQYFSILTVLGIMVMMGSAICLPSEGADFSLTGYFESQLALHDAEKTTFLNYNKLKLCLGAKVNEWVFFEGDIVFLGFQGDTEVSYTELVPDRFRTRAAQLPPVTYEDETYLDNAFVSIFFTSSSMRVGKQQLLQGSGFAWNPSDLLTEKNPFEPGYEKPGINAFVFEYRAFDYSTLILAYSPEETWNKSFRQISWRQSIPPLSFRINFGGIDPRHIYGADEPAGSFYYVSGDLMVPFNSIYLWTELLLSEGSNAADRWLIGGKYLITDRVSLITEYYVNGWGRTDEGLYTLDDWIRSTDSDLFPLAEQYVQVSMAFEPTDELTVVPMFIENLSDGSYAFSPNFTYQLSTRLLWTMTGIFTTGCQDCEFNGERSTLWTRIKMFL